ncbi:MAG: alpha-L-fucosidase [Prevotella sp.]|nr:alpha-L-fucosidase [Prevotella sp.]
MKQNFLKTYIILLLAMWLFNELHAQKTITPQDINWEVFFNQHDLVWNKITPDYYAGAIMGNGLLGNSIYKEGDNYKFHIGRVDVTEGRMPADKSQYRNLYDGARLPIGYFLIKPVGTVLSENMRLNLWDATTTGAITTDKGKISFKSYVHSTRDIIVLETDTEGKETVFQWDWNASKAISPRYTFGNKDYPQEYIDNPNPDVKIYTDGEYKLSVQNLKGGKTYVVAWQEIKKGSSRRITITITHENTEELAISKAKETIDSATKEASSSLENSHKQWWHAYYPASFASFGNTKIESFYWIQQYKLGCLTRPDKYIIDLQGPWAMEKTPWPAIWMNLNVQLTYSPLFTANRTEMSETLWKSLNDNLEHLSENVSVEEWRKDAIVMGRSTSYHLYSRLDINNKPVYEVGNLTWILYYYYQYCMYLYDENELLKKFYPLLKKSIAYYEHIKEKREDGKYHLPETASPEYKTAKDCNYDLALLQWGLKTLLDINEAYKLNDQKASVWEDFKGNLVNYPTDSEKGFMIGEDVNLTGSHRHYSHLMMIYPLYLINWDQPENRALISKSIAHWQGMPSYLQGYSFTGSSSMYSMMGDGERAVIQLQKLIDKYIQPNTLYKETGPVIETPLAGAASLQDLYLQVWNGKIRIFPAVPTDWPQASFINFRTEGAFLVSASREGGKTVFIQIKSEKGGLCRIQTAMNTDNLSIYKIGGGKVHFSVIDKSTGLLEIKTKEGDIVQIIDKTLKTIFPKPVKHLKSEQNTFGIN